MRVIRSYNDTARITDFKKVYPSVFSMIFKASSTVFNVLKFMKNTLKIKIAKMD